VDVEPKPNLVKFHHDLMNVGPGLKPVDLGAVHITLKFLGDTDENLTPQIEAVMRQAVLGIPAFSLRLANAGWFPHRPPIRVVWVGLKGAEPLAQMAHVLEEGLAIIGIAKEDRPFSPHLTMARVKDPRASFASEKMVERYKDQEFGEQVVSSIKLKRSVLSRSGPEYTTVLEVPLH
jgi:2'-5' RNA ligase